MGFDSIAATIKNPLTQNVKNAGLQGSDFPKGFVITEYSLGQPYLPNSAGVSSTQLQLVGNLMPMQPFEWEGEQRLVTEYYPGNPEPAVQVLGAKEGPVTIKGRLKDKRYSDKSFYGVSYQYNLALNNMRKRGNLVKFGMYGLNGSWIRWGYIKKGSFKMKKVSYIDYEIEFLVMSETQPKNNYFAAPEQTAPGAVNQKLIDAASAFNAQYSAVPPTMPQSIAGALNGLIGQVAAAVNTVTGFVGTIVSTAKSIQDSANRAIGLIKNAQATISKFNRSIDAFTHGFNTLSSQGNPAGQTRDTYTNVQYLAEVMAATVALEKYLAQMRSQWQSINVTVPKARYKVQVNDTLQNISVRFYGSANNAQAIAEHNNLTSNTLVPGTILEIPKV